MLLSDAINALATATIADGRSLRTADGYRANLTYLLEFLGDRPIEEISKHDLRAFQASLITRQDRYDGQKEGGLSPFSIASYMRAVKRLFNWLVEEEILDSNPARRLKLPPLGRGAPKAISLSDFQKLLDATSGDTPIEKRDKAICLFLLDTGCRVGGLIGVKVDDVDIEQGRVWVLEKRRKERVAFLSQTTIDALMAWLEIRPAMPSEPSWLFLSMGGHGLGQLRPNGVGQMLQRLAEQAHVEGPVNPHSFRHAFAREYIRAGGDMGTLADIMGHSSVQVTWQFYAIFAVSELQAKHRLFSPIARMVDNDDED